MAGTTRIVIVGGGYAGIEAAKHLHKTFKNDRSVEITLIDRNSYHTLMTELHEVAGGRVEEDSVKVPFRKIFGGMRVNVVIDKVRTIDFDSRSIFCENGEYGYDYLVLGTGAEPEFFGIPGIKEHAFTLWSLDDARKLRAHIEEMFLEAGCEPDPVKRGEMLTFVVAGAGFTGIEMAGELLEWKKELSLAHGVDENEVRVMVVEALPKILPNLPETLSLKAAKYLEKKGLELRLNSPITGASEGAFSLKDGTTVNTRTLIWTCGVQGGEFAANLSLTKGRCANRECNFAKTQGTCGQKSCQFSSTWIPGKHGRLLSNEQMQSVDYPNVYLVGDIIWFLEDGKAIPQIVETALQTSAVAAENIAADIKGHDKKSFKSNYHGFMVSLGSRYGVAHVGGMSLSGFFAMAVKHLINLHYLWGVAGVNQCWAYLRHEFLDNKAGKTIVGGHLSAKVPQYWTLPLRMFLGMKWAYEGIKKVAEGWLNPGPGGIFNAAASSVRMPGVKFGGVAEAVTAASGEVTEAVSAASGAAAETVTAASGAVVETVTAASGVVAETVTAASGAVAETVTAASGAAADAAAAAAGAASNWFADLMDRIFLVTDRPKAIMGSWGIYDWFAQTFLSISPTLTFILQAFVVIAEIAIGLALFTGTFTFAAAIASIGLGIMFIMSGWGNPELLWYLAAAVVMLGGAGRAFGMDYWIMPWLKKKWNGTTLAKRTYLYTGEPRKVKNGTVAAKEPVAQK
jgi:NADH dehydrogenase